MDHAARNARVVAHLGLVREVAGEFRRRVRERGAFDPDDLVQAGAIGLIRAAELYDPARGARFEGYAARWIRQAIRRALADHDDRDQVRIPRGVRPAAFAALRAGADLDPATLPGHVRDAVAMCRASRARVPAAEACGARCDGPAPPDALIEDEDADGSAARERSRHARLARSVAGLRPGHRDALALYYGLGGGPPLPPAEIGRRLGIPRKRASLWVIRAVAALRRTPDLRGDDPDPDPDPATPAAPPHLRPGHGPANN